MKQTLLFFFSIATSVSIMADEEKSMASAKPSSRPTSQPGSKPQSRISSVSTSQKAVDSQPPSRPSSSRPGSARPGSAARPSSGRPVGSGSASKPGTPAGGSQAGSKPGTPARLSQAGSKMGTPTGGSEAGSKPGTPFGGSQAGSNPETPTGGSQVGSKPGSVTGSKPGSVAGSQAGTRPGSAVGPGAGSRPHSVTGFQTGSVQPQTNETLLTDEGDAPLFDEQFPEDGAPGIEGGSSDFPPFPDPMMNQALMPVGAPGGDDGDDGDDDDEDEDDDDEGEGEMAEAIASDEDEDNETEMVVLDPDHPLMKRFQVALNKHLTKQDERHTLELREILETLKTRKQEREGLGVELYGVQQELARYQMNLERKHDDFTQTNQQRQRKEQHLSEVRGLYKETQFTSNKEKKKTAELQAEVENLNLRLFYMDDAKEDVRSDIAVMRRAAEKVETEVAKAEAEKQKQDLYVDRLVERVDKLKEEMAMYEAQIIAQSEETRAAKEALMEAHMEMEAIGLEKKQLYQQWNSSLIGMRRRDEAHAAMQEALHQQEQKILSLEMEMEGYKKSIQKEQEQNEKLTLILTKTERDIESVRKQLAQCQAKFDALKQEYTAYTRMLHETEQALNRALADKTLRENDLSALRKQIEREYLEKISIEDNIMERLQTQLTLDKAAQYSKRLTNKCREHTKHLESQMAEVENAIAQNTLDNVNVLARVEHLDKVREGVDDEIAEVNNIINRSEAEICKRNAAIERKQNLIDQYNKKLESLISAAGGVELGPLEIQINSLVKSLDARQQEISELKQLWLRQQSELVRLSQEKDKQLSGVESHKQQLTILSQKKIRTESEIEGHRRESYEIDRTIRNMQNDVIRLNTLLHQQRNMEVNLDQSNILQENNFIASLRETEKESIELATKLEQVKEEKERLLNSLVEAERQIMLWEKKTQLARETRAAVDSEVGQGEIKAMKAEIHRMTVRHTQLMKMQEKMIQDMEKAVSRRDTITTRGEAQSKMTKKVLTKGSFERQMLEMRRKIKATIQDANECDSEITALRDHQVDLSKSLEEKQVNCQQLQSTADTLDGDVEQMIELKQKNQFELQIKQQRAKCYQQLKDGKYTMMCKSDAAREVEKSKQDDRTQALSAIVDRLNQEFPHVQPTLRATVLSLSSRFA